jgi:hypothetical protein
MNIFLIEVYNNADYNNVHQKYLEAIRWKYDSKTPIWYIKSW